jgi:hypothetical protein
MHNRDTPAILGTQDTERKQKKQTNKTTTQNNTAQKAKKIHL